MIMTGPTLKGFESFPKCFLFQQKKGISSATMEDFSPQKNTPPKFNSEFTPQKWRLEDDPSHRGELINFQGVALG